MLVVHQTTGHWACAVRTTPQVCQILSIHRVYLTAREIRWFTLVFNPHSIALLFLFPTCAYFVYSSLDWDYRSRFCARRRTQLRNNRDLRICLRVLTWGSAEKHPVGFYFWVFEYTSGSSSWCQVWQSAGSSSLMMVHVNRNMLQQLL